MSKKNITKKPATKRSGKLTASERKRQDAEFASTVHLMNATDRQCMLGVMMVLRDEGRVGLIKKAQIVVDQFSRAGAR